MARSTKINYRGFTLIELIITLVIGGIFFITIGVLASYIETSWQKSFTLQTNADNMRYFSKELSYQLRNATTPAYVTSAAIRFIAPCVIGDSSGGSSQSYSGTFTVSNGSVTSQTSGTAVRYETLDWTVPQFVLHQILLVSTSIVHDEWYSGTKYLPGQIIWYPTGSTPDRHEVMLTGVQSLNFKYAGSLSNENKAIQVQVYATQPDTGTFIIQYRDKQIPW